MPPTAENPVHRIFSRSFDTWSRSSDENASSKAHPGGSSIPQSHSYVSTGQTHDTTLDNTQNSLEEAVQPSEPIQQVLSLSRERRPPSSDMKEEKKVDDFAPRGSIRDVSHNWDSDANFPIHEIQRIQKKTKKLRSGRVGGAQRQGVGSGSDIFRESGFEDTEGLFQHVSHSNSGTAGSSHGNSARRRSLNQWAPTADRAKDSLSEVLDSAGNRTTNDPVELNSNERPQSPQPPMSRAAAKARTRLLQDFHKPREVDLLNVSDPPTVDTSADSEEQSLTLHDLCGEAVCTDDIAWRNALCLLSQNPAHASVVDKSQLWTPLHICCLGMSPPPTYMVRALLYVHPKAAALHDDGGRLALHLVAASSADAATMQTLVDEYPPAVHHADDRGLTPLHLLIRNTRVELTLEKAKILLGLTAVGCSRQPQSPTSKRRVLQRRGEHLNMTDNSVDQWLSSSKARPVTNLNHNAMAHESHFDTYPVDVQVSLRKLAQWKHRQQGPIEDEAVKVQLSMEYDDDEDEETNPAAIPLPNGTQMPIHMLVQRAVIDEATLDVSVAVDETVEEKKPGSDHEVDSDGADDDEEQEEGITRVEERPSVLHVISLLRLFAASCPEALVFRDANGLTPLLQVMQVRDSLPSLEIVEILLGKRSAGYEALPAWAHDLPVHTLKGTDRYLNPGMVPVADTGQLPLHLAAEEMSADFSLIRTIQESYPGAIHVQDGRGRTPLHLSLGSYRRIPADPRVVEILFSESVAQIVDDYGKLPFDLLVENAYGLSASKPRTACRGGSSSSVYQKLFNASIVGAARPDTPTKIAFFLRRLRNLPPWLRIEACGTPIVQELLTEDLATPWKCALVMLDLFLLIILITVFRLQIKEFVDQLDTADLLSSWYTYSVYATAIFRMLAKLLFGGLAVYIGEFRHLCLLNVRYWIDVWAMLLSIITSVLLYGVASDERLLVLGTASTILLWLSLFGYLSHWWHGMAIFIGGFSEIAHRIVCPFIAALALVIAFAQCFYTLLQLDCSNAIGVSPVCSVRDSYRVVYMLSRGESLVDPTGVKRLSTEAGFLFAAFLAICAIFLLALLVTVLVATSQLDFDQIALNSYWEPKLAFVLLSEDFGIAVGEYSVRMNDFEARKEQLWDVYMLAMFGGEPAKGEYWFAQPLSSKVLTVASGMFVVPLWIVLGSFSAGWLWPRQLRLWLFRPLGSYGIERKATDMPEQSSLQSSDIRSEIVQMKLMSFERSNEVEKELRELKELLIIAMQE